MTQQMAAMRISREAQWAEKNGLSMTPAFAIGRILTRDQMEVTKFIAGAQSIDTFVQVLDELIRQQP
jgi:predicted DsbA family dithiol-disulfide isomerase